jgi:hypothetical protein
MPLLFTSLFTAGAGAPPPVVIFAADFSEPVTLDAPALNVVQTTQGRRALSWDAVPEAADCEILARVKISDAAAERFGIAARMSGAGGSETAIVWQINGVTAGEAGLTVYQAGGVASPYNNGRTPRSSVWYWLRMRAVGSAAQFKIWDETVPEPSAWTHEETVAVTGSGRVGLFTFDNVGRGKYCDYFSVGINGAAAPEPSQTPGTDQYRVDFGASGVLGEFTQRWATTGVSLSIATSAADILPVNVLNLQQQGRVERFQTLAATDVLPPRISAISPAVGSGADFVNTILVMRDAPDALEGDLVVRLRTGVAGDSNLGAVMRGNLATGEAVTAQLQATTGTGSNQLTLRVLTAGGGFTTLATGSFTWAINTWYFIRLNITGTTVRARIWAVGTSEPSTWTVTATNVTLPADAGPCGWVNRRRNTSFAQLAYVGFSSNPAIPAPLP